MIPGSFAANLFPVASSAGYAVDNSAMFNEPDDEYFTRTPSSATNQRTWTFSTWVKRGKLGSDQRIFTAASNGGELHFDASDKLSAYQYEGGYTWNYITTQVFRDPHAWYHIVQRVDTTQAASGDRMRLYVNGQQITAFDTSTAPSLNATGYVNSTAVHYIGRYSGSNSSHYDGYLAETVLIDGSSLAPTDFGETDTNGVWRPKKVSGLTFGTNGFYLEYKSSGGSLGNDTSGNSNNWTNTNSVTQSNDSPTKNFPVLSPLMKNAAKVTLSEGNSKTTSSTSGGNVGRVNASVAMPTAGKYYWETTVNTIGVTPSVGFVSRKDANDSISVDSSLISVYISGASGGGNGRNYYGSDLPSTGTGTYGNMTVPWTNGMVIGTAYDADNNLCWFSQNGTWIDGNGTDNSATVLSEIVNGTSGSEGFSAAEGKIGGDDLLWSVASRSVSNPFVYTQNFGATAFSYTAPTGFEVLNAATVAEASTPAIEDGSAHFQSTAYVGNTSADHAILQTETSGDSPNSTFQSDFIWFARRDSGDSRNLYDAVRGVTKRIYSNVGNAEDTTNIANMLKTFDSAGFTVGDDGAVNGTSMVAWQWYGGGSTAANGDGSLSSNVRANPTAGFSIVSYTGNGGSGGAQTVGHGLGAKPNMIWIKNRSTTDNWVVYHDDIGFNAGTLNTDAARITAGASVYWNDTAHTSTIFNVNTNAGVNGSGNSMIAYCFADVPGYSRFGYYKGNNDADGPFVELGFRPAFVMIKAITTVESWWMGDNARDGYNQGNRPMLAADSSNAEDNGWSGNAPYDALSNGFKIRRTGGAFNTDGNSYLYAAFAVHPFAGTTPGTAR